jgi:hypothetical protein
MREVNCVDCKENFGANGVIIILQHNWSRNSFVHNKSQNRLQPKKVEDLVYMYINSRLMEVEKEKYEKKWYVDNVDSENSDFVLKKDIEIHGDADSDSWDDGNLPYTGFGG